MRRTSRPNLDQLPPAAQTSAGMHVLTLLRSEPAGLTVAMLRSRLRGRMPASYLAAVEAVCDQLLRDGLLASCRRGRLICLLSDDVELASPRTSPAEVFAAFTASAAASHR